MPFEREARGKWADWTTLAPDVSCLEDVCCALHEDDCCEPAAGPIAGLVIGAVVLVAFVGGGCLRLCGLAGATKDGSRRGFACVGRRNAGPNPSHVGLLAFACCVAYLVALMPLRHWMSYKLVVETNLVGRWESRARFDLWHGAVTTKNDYLGDSKDKEAILADPKDCDDGDQFCEDLVEANNAAQSLVMAALVLASVACLAIVGWKFCCVGVDGEPNFAACDKNANAFAGRLRAAGGQRGRRRRGRDQLQVCDEGRVARPRRRIAQKRTRRNKLRTLQSRLRPVHRRGRSVSSSESSAWSCTFTVSSSRPGRPAPRVRWARSPWAA